MRGLPAEVPAWLPALAVLWQDKLKVLWGLGQEEKVKKFSHSGMETALDLDKTRVRETVLKRGVALQFCLWFLSFVFLYFLFDLPPALRMHWCWNDGGSVVVLLDLIGCNPDQKAAPVLCYGTERIWEALTGNVGTRTQRRGPLGHGG